MYTVPHAFIDDHPDLVVRWRPDGTLILANRAFRRVHGAPGEEGAGDLALPAVDPFRSLLEGGLAALTPAAPLSEGIHAWPRPVAPPAWYEWRHRGVFDPGGRLVEVYSVGRDVTERRRAEARGQRATRALRTLGQCNKALVRATTEEELLATVCQAIVEHGGYRAAWVGFAELDEDRSVRVVARAGHDAGYLERARISWADDDRGHGPTGVAIRTGAATLCRDFLTDPKMIPWRADAVTRGYGSSVALPLKADGAILGALNVYAAEPDAFDQEELDLLEQLADDLAFGIGAQRTRLALQRSASSLAGKESLLRGLIAQTPVAVAMLDTEMRYLQVSDRWVTDYHLEGQDLLGRSHYEVFPDLPERWKEVHRRALAGAIERHDEDPFPRADGSTEWLEWEVRPWHRADGAIGGISIRTQVITARKRAELELEATHAKLKLAMEVAHIGYWEYDPVADVFTFDQTLLKLYAAPEAPQGSAQMSPHEYASRFLPPEEAHVVREELARALSPYGAEHGGQLEHALVRGDGTTGHLLVRYGVVRDAEGRVVKVFGANQDITELRAATSALDYQRRRSEAILESSMDGIITVDSDHRVVVYNPAAERMFQWRAEEVLGGPLDPLIPSRHRVEHPQHLRAFERKGTDSRYKRAFPPVAGLRKDGEEFPMEASISQIHVEGQVLFTVTCRDLSERQRAERALRESEERLRQLAENVREVLWIWDVAEARVLYVSPAFERVWGIPVAELIQRPSAWLEGVHPDDRAGVQSRLQDLRVGRYDVEYRVVRPGGEIRWVHGRGFPVADEAGRIYRVVGVVEDTTERRQIEEQYRQAQKMEAVGQLAGGIAHDFNNLLGAMLMQATLAAEAPRVPPAVRESLEDVTRSIQRAANLTRQLLLFSRKEVLQPRHLDLNEVVTNMAALLRRVLPADIRIDLLLHPRPLHLRADAGMLDQILMNLAVNARDAMPRGGQLDFCTTERLLTPEESRSIPGAAPGRHVCLVVRDSGCGIPDEHLPRIFEPFFTTKGSGLGTGLGLSTVFGIVRQHRGAISVSSAVGAGTTFHVLLPASEGTAELEERAPIGPRPQGGHETILLVEDDAAVRRATRLVLERAGYHVLEAGDGAAALAAWEGSQGRIDLLLADLVMPGALGGRALADALRARSPRLKVVLTSGYSAEVFGHELEHHPGQRFLPKPVAPHQLLATLRALLDG